MFRGFVEESAGIELYPYKSQDLSFQIRKWNIDYNLIDKFVDNNIDVSFGTDYDLTPNKYYKIKTINDLLEDIVTYIE